jgi:hypothetical protein
MELRYFASSAPLGRRFTRNGNIMGLFKELGSAKFRIRAIVVSQLSASYVLFRIAAAVWQVIHAERPSFCSDVPGTLINHSALLSCDSKVLHLRELQINPGRLVGRHFRSSYPTARTFSAYFPASSLFAGKSIAALIIADHAGRNCAAGPLRAHHHTFHPLFEVGTDHATQGGHGHGGHRAGAAESHHQR